MTRVRTAISAALVLSVGLLAGCGEEPIGKETNLATDVPPPPPQFAHAKARASKVNKKFMSPPSISGPQQ